MADVAVHDEGAPLLKTRHLMQSVDPTGKDVPSNRHTVVALPTAAQCIQPARTAPIVPVRSMLARSSSNTRRKRGLVYYPWTLGDRTGALAVLLAYSQSLRAVGLDLDCVAPGDHRDLPIENGRVLGCFDRVFGPPRGATELIATLQTTGHTLVDPPLATLPGRDETTMTAAAVLASIGEYDVVAVHYTRCHSITRYLPPHVRTILFTYDLDAVVAEQEHAIHGGESQYTLEAEVQRMKAFDLVTVVGPHDYARVQAIAPDLPLIEAPPAVDSAPITPVKPDSPGMLLWLSAGAPFHALSFRWFWEHSWPRIRRACPRATLTVAGRISSVAEELGAGADPHVRLLGVVDDCESLFAAADVMLAPYYYGDGIKIKVLEALARGLPVATTTCGLSNSRLEPGTHVLVADDGEAFAANVIELVRSPEKRAALSQAAVEYVRRHHGLAAAAGPLQGAVRATFSAPPRTSTHPVPSNNALLDGLKHLVPWTVQRCRRQKIKRVALYGAGTHTRLLVPLWKAAGGPEIVAVVVSGAVTERDCAGLPVVSARYFNPRRVDAIVLSSHMYEGEMAQACAARWPKLPVHHVWRPGAAVPRSVVAQRPSPTSQTVAVPRAAATDSRRLTCTTNRPVRRVSSSSTRT